jgi:hypothetical protein
MDGRDTPIPGGEACSPWVGWQDGGRGRPGARRQATPGDWLSSGQGPDVLVMRVAAQRGRRVTTATPERIQGRPDGRALAGAKMHWQCARRCPRGRVARRLAMQMRLRDGSIEDGNRETVRPCSGLSACSRVTTAAPIPKPHAFAGDCSWRRQRPRPNMRASQPRRTAVLGGR